MRRIRTLAAIVVAATGVAGALVAPTLSDAGAVQSGAVAPPAAAPTTTPTTTPTVAPPTPPPPRKLTWSDEFGRAAGTGPDPRRWRHDTGSHGWGNKQLEYYTTSTRNAAHDGKGHLVITARREDHGGWCPYGRCRYTSARLVTNGTFAQRYGRFEARIKIPRGQGIWPAFWMLGDDFDRVGWPASGEIDVMENVGKEPGTVWATVHGPGYSGAQGIAQDRKVPGALADDFHTYAVEWSPKLLVFFLDGVEYHRVTPADLDGDDWVYDKPYHMLLNVAVGGAWPGAPNESTVFPQSMAIDWVRVWAYEPGGSAGSTPAARPAIGPWTANRRYRAGEVVTFGGTRFSVRQAHTSLRGWEPPGTPPLFQRL